MHATCSGRGGRVRHFAQGQHRQGNRVRGRQAGLGGGREQRGGGGGGAAAGGVRRQGGPQGGQEVAEGVAWDHPGEVILMRVGGRGPSRQLREKEKEPG